MRRRGGGSGQVPERGVIGAAAATIATTGRTGGVHDARCRGRDRGRCEGLAEGSQGSTVASRRTAAAVPTGPPTGGRRCRIRAGTGATVGGRGDPRATVPARSGFR